MSYLLDDFKTFATPVSRGRLVPALQRIVEESGASVEEVRERGGHFYIVEFQNGDRVQIVKDGYMLKNLLEHYETNTLDDRVRRKMRVLEAKVLVSEDAQMEIIDPVKELDDLLKLLKAKIKAPIVSGYVSTLGGPQHATLMLLVCLDKKEDWINGIMENNRYHRYSIGKDGIENFAGSGRPYMRKSKFKSFEDAVKKINDHITKYGNQNPPKMGESVVEGKLEDAENAIRDMFYHQQYRGTVPDKDIKVILKPTGQWARRYGKGTTQKAWDGLVDEKYVKKSGSNWVWVDYVEGVEEMQTAPSQIPANSLKLDSKYLGDDEIRPLFFARIANSRMPYKEKGVTITAGAAKAIVGLYNIAPDDVQKKMMAMPLKDLLQYVLRVKKMTERVQEVTPEDCARALSEETVYKDISDLYKRYNAKFSYEHPDGLTGFKTKHGYDWYKYYSDKKGYMQSGSTRGAEGATKRPVSEGSPYRINGKTEPLSEGFSPYFFAGKKGSKQEIIDAYADVLAAGGAEYRDALQKRTLRITGPFMSVKEWKDTMTQALGSGGNYNLFDLDMVYIGLSKLPAGTKIAPGREGSMILWIKHSTPEVLAYAQNKATATWKASEADIEGDVLRVYWS